MIANPNQFDVLIIGAGPAGCTAAALLAEQGRRVLVFEREKFPRYHIGESLIPFTYHPLERLGLVERMRQSHFVKKYSVQFVFPTGKASHPLYFFNRYDRNTVAQTWQVLRSEFDQMLLDNARTKGALVREETIVTALLKDNGRVTGVKAQDSQGNLADYHAPITLDCSGREAFAPVREQWRIKDPFLNKIAVWTYYEGAKRDPGLDEGATTIAMVPDQGWFWYIPQHDDRVSVGVVAEGRYLSRDGVKAPADIFRREISQNTWIAEHLASGRQTGPHFITSEYSFHSRYCAAEGLLLAGDAYTFLDPVFSSGVMFALKSGVLAADAIQAALADNDFSPARFTAYGQGLRLGIENMRKLVYAFYHPGFSFYALIQKHPGLSGDLIDCLSGDVDKDYSRLWQGISKFAPIPEALPCGLPKPRTGRN